MLPHVLARKPPSPRRPRVVTALAVAAVLLTAGCSSGKDAVATGGAFEFVAPGGQTKIFYNPPEQRGVLSGLSGDSLTEPGRQVGLPDYAGNVVVLNIWGSWCGPCRAETDDLEAVYEATKDTGVQFLGINVRDERSAAQDFVSNFQVGYPSIFDPAGRSLLTLNGFPRNVVPSTIILDRRHRVSAVFLIALVEQELLPAVQRIAAEVDVAPGATRATS